jgi:hypothetical protein
LGLARFSPRSTTANHQHRPPDSAAHPDTQPQQNTIANHRLARCFVPWRPWSHLGAWASRPLVSARCCEI